MNAAIDLYAIARPAPTRTTAEPMPRTERVKRQSGDRRWGMPAEYPLLDSNGVLVKADRRQSPE